jgi:excisionase family DNA binding protein
MPEPSFHQPGSSECEWLTTVEAARYLKVKQRTLLLWVRQGKVRGYALSGTKRRIWRFLRSDLNSALFGHYSSDVKLIAQSVLNKERSV